MKLFTLARLIISPLILIGLVFGLLACGGGGGEKPESGPAQSEAAGYYFPGTFTDKNMTETNNLMGIVNYDRFMIMNEASGLLYDATMNVNGTNFNASLIIYQNGKNPITTATASGSFAKNTSITMDIAGSGDNTIDGIVTFTFAATNNSNSDVTTIKNSLWGGFEQITTFTTSNDLTGSMSAITYKAADFFESCVHNSSLSKFISVPDTNLYTVTIVVDTCTDAAARGTYTGLASTYGSNNTMFLAVTNTNNNYSVYSQYER